MGTLSAAQQIMIRLYLLGGPQYRADLEKAGIATKGLATANEKLGRAMATTNKRSFIHNQLLFTARRALFYTTLGTIALGAEVIKMGFAYNNAMQTARVALEQVIKPQRVLNSELQKLFGIAAVTPFQVKDITVAFRQMFISFKPFHVSIGTLNDTITAISNNLSATGKVTPAALQRVSTALSHMANVGHLTGMAVQQLARDGLQLQPALQKELGITGDQIKNLGTLGIPARDVLMALIKYSKSTPGIMNAAFRQSQFSLSGAFSSFKDFVSQASGGALGGPGGDKGVFGFIQKGLAGVNKQLSEVAKTGRKVTFKDIINAMDKQLSPNTHIITNLFILFSTALKTTVIVVGALVKTISFLLRPFDLLFNLFNAGHRMTKAFGIALGVLGAIIVVGTAQWAAYRLIIDAVKFSSFGLKNAILAVNAAMGAQDILMGGEAGVGLLGKLKKFGGLRKWAFGSKSDMPNAAGRWEKAIPAASGPLAAGARVMFKLFDSAKIAKFGTALRTLVPTTWALVAGSTALEAANIWWLWIPLAIAAVVVALVVLYRKWQWFHDIVNRTFWFIKKYWEFFLIVFLPGLGIITVAIVEVIKHWGFFKNILNDVVGVIKSMIHWIKQLWGWFLKIPGLSSVIHAFGAAGGAVGRAVHWTVTSDVHPTRRATGGSVYGNRPILVGERGPELVTLPGGSNVIPNNRLNQVSSLNLRGGGTGNEKPIVVQVMLDRKVLAEGVARANQDYASRR